MAKDITVALTLDNKQFNNALAQSQKKASDFSKKTKANVDGLATAFKGLVAAIGVREIVRLGDEFTTLNNRLRAVTNSEEEAANALKLVQQVASATRSDLSAVASLFSDITLATEEMGLTQQQVAGIATTFSQALKVSGADAGTAAGAIRQFGQALASGVLRGDEFNSINEANSKFMGEFAKALGVTRGELRSMAAEGLITAELMVAATQRMASSVEADFNKTTTTIGEAFTALKASMLSLFGAVGEETGVFDGLAGAIQSLATAIDALAANTGALQLLLKVLAGVGVALASFAGLRMVTRFMNGLEAAMIALATKGTGLKNVVTGIGRSLKAMFTATGKITTAVGAAGGVFAKLAQVVFSLGAVFVGFFRILLRFAGPAGLIFSLVQVFDYLIEKLTGFSIVDWVTEKFKNLWAWIRKVGVSLGFLDEVSETVADTQSDVADSVERTVDAVEDLQDPLEVAGEKLQTYSEFLEELLKDAKESAIILGYQAKAVDEVRAMYDAGTITLTEYREALKLLNEDVIDVAERLETATSAVNDFNDAVAEGTADLETELRQLTMSELERSLDDIKTDLELLRDETLADLQDQLKDLDPVIDAAAIATIKGQMEQVTLATEEAIKAQQDLAEEAYNTARTFETGWAQAWQDYLDNLNDKAAVAKNVFSTFTKGIEDAFVNFAKTGKLSFKDLIDSMIEILIRSQVQKMIASIFGAMGGGGTGGGIGGFFKSLFGFADGGRPPVGRPSIVGERGPELFVPSTAGTIIPNEQLGMGGTVNNTYITNQISAIDAKSVAQLFAENRKTLLGTVQMAQKEMPYG